MNGAGKFVSELSINCDALTDARSSQIGHTNPRMAVWSAPAGTRNIARQMGSWTPRDGILDTHTIEPEHACVCGVQRVLLMAMARELLL
jgi:hypothetical protein